MRSSTGIVVLLAMVLFAEAHSFSRSWLNKYDRHYHGSRYRGYPVNNLHYRNYHGRNFIDDINELKYSLPDGSLVVPLEKLMLDLAGYTGHTMSKVPSIMRGIQHELYLGEHKRDPLLHAILRKYGFNYSGTGLGYGPLGTSVSTNEVNNIFSSLGLGGAATAGTGNIYGNTGGLGTPLPGAIGSINDDLFDDFDNAGLGLLANTEDSVAQQESDPTVVDDQPATED